MRNVALLLLAACGSESSPKPGAGSATAAGSGSSEIVAIDAAPPAVHRIRVQKTRAELPDLGSIQRVVAQPDGKLLVIGEEGIARVDDDLALDQTFGTGGVVKIAVKDAELQTAAIDAKGRVIVVGHVLTKKRAEDLLVVRLLRNGALDAGFGREGMATFDFGSTDDRPSAVFVKSPSDIVVIGSHQQGKGARNYEGYVAHVDAAGNLRSKVAFFDCIRDSREFVTRAIADGDGFIVGGYAYNDDVETSGVYIARVRVDGTLDPTFGEAGVRRVRGEKPIGRAVAWELAIAKNGDILLGGSSGEEFARYRGFVIRTTKDGALVPTWGNEGVAWGPRDVKWIAMVADEGDGILAVNRFDGSLTRFDTKGDVDTAFGIDGVVPGQKDDEYENGVMLDGGDVILAGMKLLVRFGPTTSSTGP